ncbi:MAG: hypothetical protein MN733_28965 [Nitrososphaera sp.]|nr:hypothetical protein [Nitrososphaera sp.]
MRRLPESINNQLVGTFPAIVLDERGKRTCAFFVRAGQDELSGAQVACSIKPLFVRTPQGPLIVVYCMAGTEDEQAEPFFSETAIFPRLGSIPSHREIARLLASRKEAYYVVCDKGGTCMLNVKTRVLDSWRNELAQKAKEFDEGKQIADEKTAIMSLYWYQERYNPSAKIFEIK